MAGDSSARADTIAVARGAEHPLVQGAAGSSRALAAVCVLALLPVLVAYARALRAPFVSDDWVFLYAVSGASGLAEMGGLLTLHSTWFVRPTQWLLTWGLYHMVGLSPVAYHAVSVVLHLLNASLLGLLVYRLAQAPGRRAQAGKLIALATSTLFLLGWRTHEAVYWFAAVNELLHTALRLGGLLAVAQLYLIKRGQTRPWPLYGALLACYVGALLSKESAIIFPVEVVLLAGYLSIATPSRRRAVPWPLLVILGLTAFTWTLAYRATALAGSVAVVQRSELQVAQASLSEWVLRFVQHLNGHFIGTAFLSRRPLLLSIELAALLGVGLAALLRRRYLWLMSLFWVAVAVTPYVAAVSKEAVRLGIPLLHQGVGGDRFLYYSSAAASLLMVLFAEWLLSEITGMLGSRAATTAVAVGYLILLLFLAANAQRLWRAGAEWMAAGQLGRGIISETVHRVPLPEPSSRLCLVGVPDSQNGKYVFRNGAAEALYLAYGRDDFRVSATTDGASPGTDLAEECTYVLQYEGATRRLVRQR